MKRLLLTVLLAMSSAAQVFATESDANSSFKSAAASELARIWNEGDTDLYLPLHTHHLRRAYSPQLLASFNEATFGLGYGRSFKDAQGGWHGLYAMAFRDSYSKVEPVVGYGRLYSLARVGEASFSVGYTAFITARHDVGRYVPIPGALPLMSVEVGRLSLMTTFAPGRRNTGNLFFIFGKVTFPK
ncbi:lipid IV(A) palmitoyltransferase PagP [Massilia sp. IC2-476]|uniref:lipid IV(A) palmitoyltransferase PagP n=1 Tax=Massilia sp. IC2-476 TaxID=2887199 RepID=UPI001D10F32A|nr:lipid IV(A) palmitoyltransferase PagP [Massilia sp. IC2-476]